MTQTKIIALEMKNRMRDSLRQMLIDSMSMPPDEAAARAEAIMRDAVKINVTRVRRSNS